MSALPPEVAYTALSAGLTGAMWMPIVANRLRETGVWKALKNPEPDLRPAAAWAYRLANAHRNAIENLAVFAPLALAVNILGVGGPATALACALFLEPRRPCADLHIRRSGAAHNRLSDRLRRAGDAVPAPPRHGVAPCLCASIRFRGRPSAGKRNWRSCTSASRMTSRIFRPTKAI